MELRVLNYFLIVAREENITRAANILHVTQPTLSRQLMQEILHVLHREFVYIWYYFSIQLEQIFQFWLLGIVIGSAVSVFGKQKIHAWFGAMKDKKLGVFGIVPEIYSV